MAETKAPHFPTWVKPDIGGDAENWGNVLNQTIDAIDSVVYANQQATVPIGTIVMFGGAGGWPANWYPCNGASLSTTTFAGLFAVIGYTYGGSGANFNVPNLQGVFPLCAGPGSQIGVDVGTSGGEANHTLSWNEMPPHSHPIEQTPHTHPGSTTFAHSHGISTGGHSHAIHTGSHSHTYVHTDAGHGGLAQGGASVGAFTDNTSTYGDLGGSTEAYGDLGGSTDTKQPGVAVAGDTAQIPGNATNNAGGGGAHNNTPPYLALSFIIRYF